MKIIFSTYLFIRKSVWANVLVWWGPRGVGRFQPPPLIYPENKKEYSICTYATIKAFRFFFIWRCLAFFKILMPNTTYVKRKRYFTLSSWGHKNLKMAKNYYCTVCPKSVVRSVVLNFLRRKFRLVLDFCFCKI